MTAQDQISDMQQAHDLKSAWILTSGHIGHEVKCLGIAAALGLVAETRIVPTRPPWSWLAPWGPVPPNSPIIRQPFPDLVIASGRQAAPYARFVRTRSGGKTFVVVIDNPAISTRYFDLVWTNSHDKLVGANVLKTLTSPHPFGDGRIATSAASLALRLPAASAGRPLIGVMVGGASKAYQLDVEVAIKLGKDLANFARSSGAFLIVTPSRRTGSEQTAAIARQLPSEDASVWDMTSGDNPYPGILGLCSSFVVTCNSVNMLGEAAVTGKAIRGYRLPGGTAKFDAFHRGLIELGAMRWFEADYQDWSYTPIDSTVEIARAIAERASGRHRRLTERST